MKKLIANIINNRKITLFLTVIIAIGGLYAYYLLPRQESPDVSVPAALIVTPYPGASPQDIKDLVTKKVEDRLTELDGYDYSKGISKDGVSVVIVFFKSDANYDKAMQDVRNAVADVQTDLPKGAMPSQLNTDIIKAAGVIISLSGENYSYDQLESFGEMFKDDLRDIDGVSKVKVEGKIDKEIRVDADVARLNLLGLSMEDICKVLAAQNIQIPSGNIEYKDSKITVNIPGNYSSVDSIKNTIISVSKEDGVVTRIRDAANVYMTTEDGVQKFKENGKNAVLLTVYFEDNKNVVIIGKDVRKAIDQVKGKLPPDITVNEVIYQPDAVSHSTNEFMFHLILGILLVIAVVFLEMGVRNALVVSTSIPLSILAAFLVMYLTGIKIHQVSLASLIIALGILVDDSIVVCDNIQVRMDEGVERLQAAYAGAARCTAPNFAATFSIIVAFSPLLGIPGAPGQFMKAIPLVIIISIIASYIISMFVIPSMMACFAKAKKKKHVEKESRARLFFKWALRNCLKQKALTVISAFIIMALVVGIIVPRLTTQFFPYVDKDIFYIDINSEKAADMDAAEKLTDEVKALLAREQEVKSCTVSIGDGLPKFYITMPPPKPSRDYAQMVVKFDLEKTKKYKDNVEFADYVQRLLDQNISSGKCKVKLLEYAVPTDAKVIARVTGNNLDRLIQVSNELKSETAKIPGTSNVRSSWNDSTLQLDIKMDEDKASSLGITKYDVQKEINIALYGYKASVYRKDGQEFNVRVKSDIKDTSLLENFKIKSSITGNKIPLKEFATIGYSEKLDTINTFNNVQAIEVLADPMPGFDSANIENQIELVILPELDTSGTKITFDGEREDIKENFTMLGILAVLAVFMIYVVLVIQFKSFIQPIVTLVAIPLSLIGSLLGLYIFKQPMSLTAFLGIIALIGLVVKNGILLIDFINEARRNGYSIDEACIDAVGKRFNAVILSAMTVILALIPLAFSGSSLFAPMAVSLMAGLTVATFLTMVIVPVIYSMIETAIEKRMKQSITPNETNIEI